MSGLRMQFNCKLVNYTVSSVLVKTRISDLNWKQFLALHIYKYQLSSVDTFIQLKCDGLLQVKKESCIALNYLHVTRVKISVGVMINMYCIC